MQREGWEFAQQDSVRYGTLHGEVMVVARHRRTGVVLAGTGRALGFGDFGHTLEGEIVFETCRRDGQMIMQVYGQMPAFGRVDMSYSPEPITMRALYAEGIFRPWKDPQELIVAPDKVADILERIKQMQEPELLAIRERNRKREMREQAPEFAHATILSLAA